jgi:hypothetical protein
VVAVNMSIIMEHTFAPSELATCRCIETRVQDVRHFLEEDTIGPFDLCATV